MDNQNLTFKQYENLVIETGMYHDSIAKFVASLEIPDLHNRVRLHKLLAKLYVTLGMIGEAGEIAEKMKKIIRDKQCEISAEDNLLLKKESGDVLWYVGADATELGTTLTDIAQINIDKLQSRYQRGVISGSGDNR